MYAITESYVYYEGGDATHWGVYKTLEGAKKRLIEIIKDKFDYIKDMMYEDDEEECEKEFDKWIEDRFVKTDGCEVMWEDEDDDSVTKFYIDETEVED